ncbi:MAG: 4-(cytidine 5'-diphospho)-2-C-methyl-D-erythritol kinase [candidate division Zixibacteria bacterium]|nr:4-(cytidine 5'-diphospho)-2-C-methyl-D-erythritol kinase [candidate division Zixibacteria bacterium]
MDKVNLKAPAKINLYLRVLDKRPDGYHNIDSLMQAVSLYDEITLERSDKIELICADFDDLPAGDNLAHKAAELMAGMSNFPGVRITLKKNIPIGAGLGGGSSDAAFVIRGLIKLYNLRLNNTELIRKSAALGADIPFFLSSGQALVSGIGDTIEPCHYTGQYRILIIKPPFAVETAKAYSELDRLRSGKLSLTNTKKMALLQRNIVDQDFVRIANLFTNDMEEVVFSWHHELSRLKHSLRQEGAFYAGMSGSGAAVFGLFPLGRGIEKLAKKFNVGRNLVFICKPEVLLPAN